MEAQQEQQNNQESLTTPDDHSDPMECCFDASCSPIIKWTMAPPFLMKTYEMADDPTINSIISWDSTGTNLIVWDPYKFANEVMLKYFSHNNFQSFVCQLNSYGFKKVCWDRWEFHNEWFQKGKKSLLENIKRRVKIPKGGLQQDNDAEPIEERSMLEMVHAVESLKNKRHAMNEEMMMLKKQVEDTEMELETIKKKMQIRNSKQQKLIMIVANAISEKRKEWEKNEVAKKPRLFQQEITERLVDLDDLGDQSHPTFGEVELLEKFLLECDVDLLPEEEMTSHQPKITIDLEDLLGE